MTDLQAELRALTVDWPETPDLAGRVAERLETARAPRRRGIGLGLRPGWRPAVAYAFAAVATAFALTMAVSPDARSAVLEFLGLKSVRVERREPTAPPPRPGTLGSRLGLGTPVTLAEARRARPFLRLPEAAGLGSPDAVYAGRRSVALVYGSRPGYVRARTTGAALLVQEFPGRVGPFIEKTLGEAAELRRLRVDGAPAYFITGAHGFAYEGESPGNIRFEDQRLAGNTLLVERAGGLVLRIEGDISADRAVEIARSIP